MSTDSGRMLLISGPSGSGKSTLCRRLKDRGDVTFSVSATTRAPRLGEVHGVDYHFMDADEFERLAAEGAFIEHAHVHGNLYGTLRAPMEEAIGRGLVYLVEIDVQGALQLKDLGTPGIYVFVDVPNLDQLRERLEARGTDPPEVVARRLTRAEVERGERERYDHVIVNDDLERAYSELLEIAGLTGRGVSH